jgi:hypothetical protein
VPPTRSLGVDDGGPQGKLWGTDELWGTPPAFTDLSERLRPDRQYFLPRNHDERPLPQALPAQTGGRLVHGTRVGYSLRVLLSTSATASPLIVISRRFSSGSWRLWLEVFADVAEADAEVLSALEELVGCPEGRCPTRPRGPEFNPKATKALQTIEHDPEDLVAHRHVAERHPTKRVEYPAGGVLGSACAQEVTHETLKGIVVALSVRFAQFPRALSTCSLPKSNFVEQLLDEVASLRRACPAEQCCVAIFADACSEDAE